MKKTITVLQADIDNGRQQSALGCPVALAVKREWNAEGGFVGQGTMTVVLDGRAYHTPAHNPVLGAFVLAFDNGKAVEPFKAEVELVEWERKRS